MGASGWYHFVPYQADINAALQALRQQVYEDGSYYHVDHNEWRNLTEDEAREKWLTSGDRIGKTIYNEWRNVKTLKKPTTPDELVSWNREDGTHSVIDIIRVSQGVQTGTVSPLTDEQLIKAFGTTQPTREQLNTWVSQGAYDKYRGRWEGVYVIEYADGVPSEICFAGFSGD